MPSVQRGLTPVTCTAAFATAHVGEDADDTTLWLVPEQWQQAPQCFVLTVLGHIIDAEEWASKQ